MATVFLAIQESFGRKVALKVLMPKGQQDPSFAERFASEAKITAHLAHPNIVPVYDVGKVDDYHYISMEYLDRHDLTTRLKKRNIKLGEIIRATREIAQALDYAHRKGFVHRDVKPDNILFRHDGTAVLTDFGIAKAQASDNNMTQVGKVIGTPKYMSPEQTRGEDLNSTCDLYSLGIILFEMLTGKVPFDGRDPFDIGIKHLKDPVPRLPANKAVFQPLLDSMLAKEKSRRIQTGREVVEALEGIHKTLLQMAAEKKKRQATAAGQSQQQTVQAAGKKAATSAGADSVMRADASDRVVAAGNGGGNNGNGNGNGNNGNGQPSGKKSKRVYTVLLVLVLLMGGAFAAVWFAPDYAEDNEPLMALHSSLMEALGIVDPIQQAIENNLTRAREAEQMGRLFEPPGDNALEYYHAVLELDAEHAEALQGVAELAGSLVADAMPKIESEAFAQARSLLDQAEQVSESAPGLASAREKLLAAEQVAKQRATLQEQELARQQREAAAREQALAERRAAEERARQARLREQQEQERLRQEELARQQAQADQAAALFSNVRVRGLLARADTHFSRGEYRQPAGDNALEAYAEALSLDPDNQQVIAGIERTVKMIIPEMEVLLQEQQFRKARELYEKLLETVPESEALQEYGHTKGW